MNQGDQVTSSSFQKNQLIFRALEKQEKVIVDIKIEIVVQNLCSTSKFILLYLS